ncbi:MAG: cytidine deaminase [Desulfurispora sp.]|uniref:cytidine deaminase n=1 Tax=Desulfurispora sp. TaxID=3014275 RepID=UPI0040497DC9
MLSAKEIELLIEAARRVRDQAYAPYSGFLVGAALLTADGQVYTGCNVENASYGLTCCAERVAIYKAVSEGHRQFVALAVIAGTEDYCRPCGACRQVLVEFAPALTVLMCNQHGQYEQCLAGELLPGYFAL